MSTSDVPGGQPPANRDPYGTGPDEGGRTFGAGVLAAVAVAVLVIAGLGGYLIGHSSGDDEGKRSGEASGQQAGFQRGLEQGRTEGAAPFQRGESGYKLIYDAGKAKGVQIGLKRGTAAGEKAGEAIGERSGERVGFEQGERQGVTTGESEGVRQGAAAVLGGFNWSEGTYYIVDFAASSTAGVPFTIANRTQLQPGSSYTLCADGGVCTSAAGSGGGSGNGGGNSGGASDPNE
ncbi:MAG TPA: hypothetical protein VLK58_24765 [Conexibacter sp.]|nr:hypothetical protein [Conexibacter sp.]